MPDTPVPVERATVILPALNEERGLRLTLEAVAEHAPGVSVSVIDDGSSDSTAAVAADAGVRVIRHASRRGKGAAIRSGASASSTDFLVVMDADATYPAVAIVPMIALLADGHDYVSGVRHAGRRHIPVVNRLGNAMIGATIRWMSGSMLRDPLTGMYGMHRRAWDILQPSADGFAIETEIAVRAARMKMRTAEMPITYAEREGES
ncbi:MAG TPA: glycosyltransferase family 2 protein, partial [Candidatus Limnocylindria bacterium]